MTLSTGKAAELVWDSKYGQNCSTAFPNNKIICGSTKYTVPVRYSGGTWIDLMGTGKSLGTSVTIGANPILLEAP